MEIQCEQRGQCCGGLVIFGATFAYKRRLFAEVFDEIFDGLVSGNVEGTVVRGGSAQGFSFDESTLHRLIADEPMQAAGAAALTLAWQCRSKILSV